MILLMLLEDDNVQPVHNFEGARGGDLESRASSNSRAPPQLSGQSTSAHVSDMNFFIIS